ncbi:paraneoplastic antigen-like protein 8B [Perognathus longimembris pacificus]|uniref:paraneoplastic antigen-like protein 8B n=1 Tax=Perognathus longimembris pacificus TaxID=214514 RepID=UPI002019EC79|nr:paraneoplastic antigen-like protein 8B [Perognathus longimembris pacificus]
MAMSLFQNWCRGLNVDEHRALLVTGIPEGLERAEIEATLQPTFLPLGKFRLLTVSVGSQEKARAALVEFLEDIDVDAIPREVPGKAGVWQVLSKDRSQDTRVLKQMKRLLLDERPAKASRDAATPPAAETQAQEAGQAGKADPDGAAKKAQRGRRGGRHRARGHRLASKCKKRVRGGRRARSASGDSSDDSLGLVIEELQAEDLTVDEDQRALYETLQAAAKELLKKWTFEEEADAGDGPREFLALVTVTDKAKKEELEKELPGTQSICLDIKEDRNGVPDLVALMAVREPVESDDSESESQDNEDPETEGPDNPEFVAIVAYTEPSAPWAREEMLKIASVIQSLGWGDKRQESEALPQVLSVMSNHTSGTRVKVEEAGRQVDAMVLKKAEEDGNLLECISTLAEPENRPKGKKGALGFPGSWGKEGEVQGGLLELVALLAAQDMVHLVKEEEENRCGGAKCNHKNDLEEVLTFLASRERLESSEDSEESEDTESESSEDTESPESEPEDRASQKPRAKRARTGSKGLARGPAAAVPAAPRTRQSRRGGRGRGRAVTPEKKAGSEASIDDDATTKKKKKGLGGTGARARAAEAKGQPPAGPKSVRGKKARRGPKRPPKCR